jgi:hypothetical protein
VATAVHFVLSIAYAAPVGPLVERQPPGRAGIREMAFGLALYLVNTHGFTWIFPWFAQARDWITVVAHFAFGLVGAVAYRHGIRWQLA